MDNEIEQMRARVAAAWGVDVGEVDHRPTIHRIGNAEKFSIQKGSASMEYSEELGNLLVFNGENLVNAVFIEGTFLNELRFLDLPWITRFFFCMGYDIQFLIDAGVTVTGHEMSVWMDEMRDAGHPIEPRGEME